MTEFQQATWLMRSWKEPPSRVSPGLAMTFPSGLVMSAVAGLPSIQ